VQVFKLEFRYRFKPRNYVFGLIAASDLNCIFAANSLLPDTLRRDKFPHLELNAAEFLICARGRHRLAAALRFYYKKPNEQWWMMDLFKSDGKSSCDIF
jgi:hypothetical protein